MIAKLALLALLPLLATAAPTLTKRLDGVTIKHNGDIRACLTVPDTNVTDGSLVNTGSCTATGNVHDKWDISAGDNLSVKLTGTNFCLDAGTNPHNNVPMKVWTCYPGLASQRWYLTDDNRIAITGGDQCLDLGESGPQTYQCTPGNTNQIWNVGTPVGPTSTSVGPTSTSSTPSGPTSTAPVSPGKQIHPNGNATECLTVGTGYAADGAVVNINTCAQGSPTDQGINAFQRWDIVDGSTKVKLHGTNYCLDAGLPMGNGVGAKIWTCLDVPQQQWYYTGAVDKHLAIQGGNQCLDVKAESGPTSTKPYGSLKDVQTWECSGPDVNQLWTLS